MLLTGAPRVNRLSVKSPEWPTQEMRRPENGHMVFPFPYLYPADAGEYRSPLSPFSHSGADGSIGPPVRPASSIMSRRKSGSIIRTVSANGSVNPVNAEPIRTHVSGVIHSLYCAIDTKVKAGQLCAKIDPNPYQTAVDRERVNLAEAVAQLEKDMVTLAHVNASL
jgi:hypothetical protein